MKLIIKKLRAVKNKYFYLFIFLGFILLFSTILRLLTPNTAITENTWRELTPGESLASDVQKKLGEPNAVSTYSNYSVLKYDSSFPTMPHEIAIDKNNRIIFIKEYLAYDENHKLNQYVEKYGQIDLSLYAPMISEAVKAHIFLKEGLVIIAHLQNDAVEQKWYFVPTDQKTFVKSWEKELTKIQKGPEKFIPQ